MGGNSSVSASQSHRMKSIRTPSNILDSLREQQIPAQYSHLSSNQRNQQVLSQLYSQNSLDVDQYYANQGYSGPRPGQFNGINSEIKVQKTVPLKTELIVNKATITLKQVNAQVYALSFEYTFDVEADVSIFFGGIDQIDDASKTTVNIDNTAGSKLGNNVFRIAPGVKQQWDSSCYLLDTRKISIDRLLKYDGNFTYPLIIKCDKVDKSKENKKIYIYCTIHQSRNNTLGVIVQKSKFEYNNAGYWTEEVFGIAESGLNSNSEKDCSICLCDKIDTIILPCRHMCLCYACCNDLKKKASKCPICRQGMTSFLKLVQYREQQQQQQQSQDQPQQPPNQTQQQQQQQQQNPQQIYSYPQGGGQQ